MMQAALLEELDRCANDGLLRRLGSSFARYMASLGAMPPCVIVACVLLSELESRGHSCLPLEDLSNDPCAMLGLDDEQCGRLQEIVGSFPATVSAWTEVLAQCPQVWKAGDSHCGQPLVLEHERLYLRRYWRDERAVAGALARRTEVIRHVDCKAVASWLNRLFAAPVAEPSHDWQKTACAVAVRSAVSIITGGPGTGKTYTVARLLALVFALSPRPERLRVAMAAPSGKAAVRLKQSIDSALQELVKSIGPHLDLAALMDRLPAANTLHSLLGFSPETRSVRHNADNPLDVDVLIVDEASMVHLEMMAALLAALPPDAMLVLLGDKDQLASVEAGAVLGDLCEGAQQGNYSPQTADYVARACSQAIPAAMVADGSALAQQTVMLRKSHRFSGPIGQLALAVNAGNATAAREVLCRPGDEQLMWYQHAKTQHLLELAAGGRPGATGGYREYLALVAKHPGAADPCVHTAWVTSVLKAFDQFRVLCAVRQGDWGVEGVNQVIERHLAHEKSLTRRGEWYPGRPVLVTRNDYGVGVYNGDVGIALPDGTPDATLRVYFRSAEKVWSVLPTRLAAVETAFAMTVHKVQGSEFAHTVLVLPDHLGKVVVRELIYTGVTRASKRFTLVTPVPAVLEAGIERQTVRASGLRAFMQAAQAD